LSLRSDDLDSVIELYTEDDFRQLVMTTETMPTFLGGLCELKDHGEGGLGPRLTDKKAVRVDPKRRSL
jgi:hypothetical protein